MSDPLKLRDLLAEARVMMFADAKANRGFVDRLFALNEKILAAIAEFDADFDGSSCPQCGCECCEVGREEQTAKGKP
jgi:hypothetical protein